MQSARDASTLYPMSASAWMVMALKGFVFLLLRMGVMTSRPRTDSRQWLVSPELWTGTFFPE